VMYATKRGYKWPKSWRRRFFCLDNDGLYYYKTMDVVRRNGVQKGSIRCMDMLDQNCIDTVQDTVLDQREHCIRLHTNARTFYIQFDTDKERSEFINVVKNKIICGHT
jgi:hypothetical protein